MSDTKIKLDNITIEISANKEHKGVDFLVSELKLVLGEVLDRYEYFFSNKEEGQIKTEVKIGFTLGEE